MDIIDMLHDKAQWQRFCDYKFQGGHLSQEEEADLLAFVQQEQYREPVQIIRNGECFAPPRMAQISKAHSQKKRTVFLFPREENYVLKFLTFLLQERYDHLFAPNLYSFRPGTGVRDAIHAITGRQGIKNLWCYKADIQNYFNSIPVEKLLPVLEEALVDQPDILRFLKLLLTDPQAERDGQLLEIQKGIMAGCPVSTFLANLYLSHLDRYFHNNNVLYARYSDDIILFADSREMLERHIRMVHSTLADAGLLINSSKEQISAPGEPWVFLGIIYQNGIIDVAPVSVEKLKAKMHRKVRALVRWQARKQTTGAQTAKAFIRAFRRKLFCNDCEHELTWTRWYFPLITTAESLHAIDLYAQECIRYLVTGTRTKARYNCRYEDMKALGYVSLVHCYYAHLRFPENSQETVD